MIIEIHIDACKNIKIHDLGISIERKYLILKSIQANENKKTEADFSHRFSP